MSGLKIVKPSSECERATKTTVDTVEITEKLLKTWKAPPFQRDLKVNGKVVAVAEMIKQAGGVIPGVLTVGVLDNVTYIVDGQHRIKAWLMSGVELGYADVRTHWFQTLGEMASEFVALNSSLVRLRPDDILRGMEPSTPALQRIRRKCGFIGYDMIRRNDKAPVLSMSMFIRTWIGTRTEVPSAPPSTTAVACLTDDETATAIKFADVCYAAWQRDPEYVRLWAHLNLTLCAWVYRRSVLGQLSTISKTTCLTDAEFRQCLMALSADGQFLDYLVGRSIGERDRGPAYARIKTIFQRRYCSETGRRLSLPQPAWGHSSKR